MPKSLADGRKKVTLLATKPADLAAITLTELEAGLEASCRIVSSTYAVGPQASATVDEKPLCVEGNVQALGASNYGAEFDIFRYFDLTTGLPETGEADTEEGIGDEIFQMLKAKGTVVWLVERETSKKSTDAWEAGDPYEVYELLLDNPQKPTDQGGYIKRHIVGLPQNVELDGTVAGAPTGG